MKTKSDHLNRCQRADKNSICFHNENTQQTKNKKILPQHNKSQYEKPTANMIQC